MNPDGTGQMIYYGNMHPKTVMIDAKPIPGTGAVVSVFSPGHGKKEHAGAITIVNPKRGPDELSYAHKLDKHKLNKKEEFRDPYPLSADCILAAHNRDIVLMNGQGRTRTIHSLGGLLAARTAASAPAQTRAGDSVAYESGVENRASDSGRCHPWSQHGGRQAGPDQETARPGDPPQTDQPFRYYGAYQPGRHVHPASHTR
ncbi:MAG: hypothetical protein ACYSUD_11345, partial [Planctomycetota bacterium]